MAVPITPDGLRQLRILLDEGVGGYTHQTVASLVAEIDRLAEAPQGAWWLKSDDDFEVNDPELFHTERAAKDDAIRVYREANDLTDDYLGWLGKELPDFAWREHREGGIELYVDAVATGLIVRQLTVKGTATPVTTDA